MFDSPDEFEECKDTFSCKRPKIHDSLKTDVKSSQSSPNLCPRNVQLNVNDEEFNQPLTPSSSNVHSSQNSSNSSINTSSKKESPVNNMLNLNLNDKRPSQSGQSNQATANQPQQNQPDIPCDLLGNFNAQNIDLLNDLVSGDKSSQQRRSTNTSNLDLLNELFHSETNPNGGQSHSGNPTTSSGPDLLSEPNGARASENLRNHQANNLDPFEELFGGASSGHSQHQPSTGNGLRFPLNSTQPPLKPTTSNAKLNNIPKFTSSSAFQRPQKPDYNRAYFKEPSPSSNNGPKLAEDAFGDLLGDFTKNTQSDWNKNGKSMAQLKREEMVSGTLVVQIKKLSFSNFNLNLLFHS